MNDKLSKNLIYETQKKMNELYNQILKSQELMAVPNVIVSQTCTVQPRKGTQITSITGNPTIRNDYNWHKCKHEIKQALIQIKNYYKATYNLSQEEIDQIMKEIKEEQAQLPFDFSTPPTEEQYKNLYKPMVKKNQCDHDWKTYTGLQQTDTFCTKCNEIKK